MKYLFLFPIVLLTGCGVVPVSYNVFGSSGAKFTAPDLCQALVACQKSGETQCNYQTTLETDAASARQYVEVCKAVKK